MRIFSFLFPLITPLGVVNVEQVTYNATDGATMGRISTEKISFYGATPIVQAAISTAISTTASISVAPYGYSTSSEALQISRAVSTMAAQLLALGLFRTDV